MSERKDEEGGREWCRGKKKAKGKEEGSLSIGGPETAAIEWRGTEGGRRQRVG